MAEGDSLVTAESCAAVDDTDICVATDAVDTVRNGDETVVVLVNERITGVGDTELIVGILKTYIVTTGTRGSDRSALSAANFLTYAGTSVLPDAPFRVLMSGHLQT